MSNHVEPQLFTDAGCRKERLVSIRVRRFLVFLPTGEVIPVETGGTKKDAIAVVQTSVPGVNPRHITAEEIR